MAPTLRDADAGALVHVDEHGRVRSPGRLHALRALSAGAALLLVPAGVAALAWMSPAVGALGGATLVAVFVTTFRRRREVDAALQLAAVGRLDEAERLLRRWVGWGADADQARVHEALSALALQRGDAAAALAEARAAVALHGGPGRPRTLDARAARLAEARALALLARPHEARRALAALGTAPEGDWLRLQRLTTETLVDFVEGRPTFDGDELYCRSRFALDLTIGAPLLALCAWAADALADPELCDLLVDETLDRAAPGGDDAVLRRLRPWIEARAPSVRALVRP